MKKQNGITLIALVITIIVLLILAGVSISMISGDNGIATRAQQAKTETEEQNYLDEFKMYYNEYILEKNFDDSYYGPDFVSDEIKYIGNGSNLNKGDYEIYKFKSKYIKVYIDLDTENVQELEYLGNSYYDSIEGETFYENED